MHPLAALLLAACTSAPDDLAEQLPEPAPQAVVTPVAATPAAEPPPVDPDVPTIERLPDPASVPFHPTGLQNGDFAPELALEDLLNGGTFRLSDHVGPTATGPTQAMLVSISASWCGPCRASLPHFAELREEHGDALGIVIVSMDKKASGRDREVAQVREHGMDLPVLHATEGVLRAYMGDRRNIPHFYIVNRAGEVLVQDRGYGDNVKRILPGQIRYALSHPEYVKR